MMLHTGLRLKGMERNVLGGQRNKDHVFSLML